MPISGDDSAFNRHRFIAKPALEHPSSLGVGVNPEYVHKILDRVERLITKLEQAVNKSPPGSTGSSRSSETIKAQLESIKSDAPDYKKEGILVLKECASLVDGELNNIHHQLNP